ncbi:ROK family transcriptional regulator [Agromyces sp. LHK192]|uniref:ROK family transcriptional regulator n=1 Tax=Agromyces sp. LHK192 TaxID=2498704 RepID=UPI000FDC2DED|nr:ROK family transcriptional regulator [Agromyces sp. LHK192]
MAEIDAGTPTWLRARNDREAFRLLLEHGPLTRARLGELSGLSKPTAAQMISRLERVGLIRAVGEVSAGRGPNAVSYGVRTDRIAGVAVAMLNDEARATLVDVVGAEHPIAIVPHDRASRSPEGDVRRAVEAACRVADIDPGAVRLVTVGVQAAYDADGDVISYTDTLPGWPAVGARRRIELALESEVVLENDVNLAAMAERAGGAATDASSFVLLWMGDGLGVATDVGGLVQRGAVGGAGEIGYLEVPRSAARLDPAAEDYTDLLGGRAVARLLGEPGARLAEVLAGLPEQDGALAALADRVALAVVPIVALIDPEVVVLGGPTGVAGGARLAELVAERSDLAMHPGVPIRASGIGPDGVLDGARRLLVGRIRDRLEMQISTAAIPLGA